MKNYKTLIACFGAAALLAGCATKGYNQADRTAATLQTAAQRVDQGTGQLSATLTALTNLANNPGGDLKTQFATFDQNLRQLASVTKDISAKAAAMQKRGAAYFQTWDEELAKIQNEDIRQRSAQRRSEVMAQFEGVKTSYIAARDALGPLVSELNDIRTALSADLTAQGLAAIQGSVSKAQSDGTTAGDALTRLGADFRNLGASLSSGTPTPAPAK